MCRQSFLHTEREEKLAFEFRESSGKLGLKMTNTTHTYERKMVRLSYFVPGYVISNINYPYIYQSENVKMVRQVSTREVALYFGGATTHDFLGT